MQFSKFAGSDESITRLGFGAMGLGGTLGSYQEEELIRSVLHSLEKGVNLIDTARAYGDSERLVGKALKEWTGKKPFLASKIQSRYPGGVGWGTVIPVEEAFPKGWLRESTEISLRELDVDCIDLMQLHQYWPQWNKHEYWLEELLQLKQEGKIRYIGVSLPDQRHDIALPLVQSGMVDAVQTVFNIFDPLALDCLIPFCQENNVAFIARCIMDEGGLSGFLTEDTKFEDSDYRKSFFDYVPRSMYMERIDRLRQFVPQYADSLAELAIKFVLKHPGVTTALVSMHVPEYADQNIAVLAKDPLPDEVFEEIFRYHRWIRNFYDTKFW
ncbi:aldo/keto reductase [Paenibacillus glycanilyticus]|uniref:Oxidoreductase n=1 Tax=Paenibacillus glycanilyticus TaxID=126569 RepID=A0ABQ6G7S9_9BACL|nr:aldo/keto reductase [Paenibacillus glycanilyticus]GLX67009.1 oxidoreductase [Paenibacillus glycanilyticus]